MLSFSEYLEDLEEAVNAMAAAEAKRNAELNSHNSKVQLDLRIKAQKDRAKLKQDAIKKKLQLAQIKDPDKFKKRQDKKTYNDIKKRIGM